MAYGATTDKGSDAPPVLSTEEWEIIDRLDQNYVKWADSEEVTLGMADLSPLWNRLGKKLVETVVGWDVTLLDLLHK